MIQSVNINVAAQPSTGGPEAFLVLSQNENGRQISFRILGDDLPAGCTATFSGTKPDGTVYSKACTIDGNFVLMSENMQMTAVAGRWDAKLTISKGTENIMTSLIRVTIVADAVNGDAIPSDSQLEGIVAECKSYAEAAKNEAYGSPLTASTAAAMTDTGRVYVYTGSETGYTNGHWYYHNGSTWTDGGVYNAVEVDTDTTLSISGKAADAKVTGDKINELKSGLTDTGLIESVPFNSENDGHYISSQGGVGSHDSFSMTDPFLLKKGCKLTFKARGYAGNVAVIASVNNNGTYTALVVDDGSTDVKEYTYTADYDRNIVLSYKIASEHIATIIYNVKETINGLEDTIESYGIEYDVDFSQIKNGYVDSTGYLSQSENFCYTDPFRLIAGETITVTARGYLAYIAMISEYDESSRYGYKPLVISIDSTVREYSYTAVKDIDIVLSFSKNYTHTAKVSLNIKDAIVESKPNNIPDYMQLFPRMAVIGDSLSSGELVINSVATDIYGDSWLSFIAKKTNASARTHYSVGGLTAKGWIETYLSKMQSDDPFNAYFVALGTNDNYSHPYDLGTISDVVGSNTFVGYYKQIIEAVRTKAPNSAIFCVSLYNNGEAHHTYSDMIESIAELYDNCFYLDFINKSEIFTSTNGVWSASSHFTTLGYKYVADIIYNLVCEVVDKNKEFFKWFGKYNSVGGQFEE